MMGKIFKQVLFLLVLMPAMHANAQADSLSFYNEKNKKADAGQYQKPVVRKISPDSIRILKSSKEYAYISYMDSVLRNRKNQIPAKPRISPSLFPEKSMFYLQRLFFLFTLIAVAWFIWQFALGKRWFFSRKNSEMQQVNNQSELQQEDLDFARLAEKAAQSGDHRLAIRYFYLHCLQSLSNQERISLAAEKTNEDYRREMRKDPDYAAFTTLTQWYERTWFGHYSLAENQYRTIYQTFIPALKKRNA